ncbi:MAG: alpha/beta hydrolase [Prevotellaceae bacterium]|nr:alpha/beta hydrolase [Prevotellaceae bacterium]
MIHFINRRLKHLITLLTVILLSVGQAYGLTGSWCGELAIGQAKLRLVFHFSETADRTTQCTLDSPSQGVKGLPTTVTFCTADSISLTCSTIGASYHGRITNLSIQGTFQQHGYSFPLNLSPEVPLEERRPQTPKPPFPYSTIDTVFAAPDGALMSATLTIPDNVPNKKTAAVVMVTGSGPQNRDEELFDHRPFAVIADHLARHGIASLRYDGRGTGKSAGNFLTATTDTLKGDAMSGITFLRSIASIAEVGVLGHSEGGTIAFMLGAEDAPDFIVSLAGLAISGREGLMKQNSHLLDRSRLTDTDKENGLKLIGLVFDTMIEQRRMGVSSSIDIDSIVRASGLTIAPQIVSSLKMTQKIRTPWFDALLSLNPREYLKNVKCPVLAINGEKDTQVEADNLAVIQELVPQAQTRLMPELNHLMQHSVSGEADEYDKIQETISPEVLDIIVQFIKDHSCK